jgi:hypothetical protein
MTLTGVLFQPFEFAVGVRLAVMVGGVLSRLTVAHALADNPVLSRAVPQMDCFAPSAVTVTGGEQLARGYVPGVQTKLTVGFTLFQPWAFGVGETVAAIMGAFGATV